MRFGDGERTADELLDWLSWSYAQDGQRFWPPDDTAGECVENFDLNPDSFEAGVEHGKHCRAWLDATEFMNQLEKRGADPMERAAREQRALYKHSDTEQTALDWTWYTGTRIDTDAADGGDSA